MTRLEEEEMTHRCLPSCAIFCLIVAGMPAAAAALPTCQQLATDPAFGLAGNPQVTALSTTLLPAGVELTPFGPVPYTAYCRIDFTFSGESGPGAGYLPGQSQQIGLRVGLPPNAVDIGSPTAAGAVPWNGKNRDLGGGVYVGSVGSVVSSTNRGYVGTSTDAGHEDSPLSGSFALNPDGTLNFGLIEDFAADGIHEQ